jgi:hypothetical protein
VNHFLPLVFSLRSGLPFALGGAYMPPFGMYAAVPMASPSQTQQHDVCATPPYEASVTRPLRKSMVKLSPRKKSRPSRPSTRALGGGVWANTGKSRRSCPKVTAPFRMTRGAKSIPLRVGRIAPLCESSASKLHKLQANLAAHRGGRLVQGVERY